MATSAHRSEARLRNYNARPSRGQLTACSDILSGALSGRPQQLQQPSFPNGVNSSSTPLAPMNSATVVHSQNTVQQLVLAASFEQFVFELPC